MAAERMASLVAFLMLAVGEKARETVADENPVSLANSTEVIRFFRRIRVTVWFI